MVYTTLYNGQCAGWSTVGSHEDLLSVFFSLVHLKLVLKEILICEYCEISAYDCRYFIFVCRSVKMHPSTM